jgi:energy-coupling factor transport system ATP-binding protein
MVNPHEALLSALSSHRHAYVSGPNFSARSEALQHITRLPSASETPGSDSYGNKLPDSANSRADERFAYVGPEIYHSLSGLATSVKSELMLHSFGNQREITRLAMEADLDDVLDRSCFELSGGQQAILATVAATALRPRVLALDCCLEQVDADRRDSLLRAVAGFNSETSMVIADNELKGLPFLDGATELRMEPAGDLPPMSAERCREAFQPRYPAPVLRLEGLCFSYPRSGPVLRDAEATLAPGAIYWLRGANGSGKSTVSKLLAGVLTPQRGLIFADGKPIRPALKPGALVSYHFQNPDLQLFSTTAWDEVNAGPLAQGCSEAEAAWRARHVLDQVAIAPTFDRDHPLDLPFTLRKRLALAAAVACGCPWLILDEPSLGQDAENTSAIGDLIRGLAESGAGVLVISHAQRLMDQLPVVELEMADGKIIARAVGNAAGRRPL